MKTKAYFISPYYKLGKEKNSLIQSEVKWKGHRSMDHEKSYQEDLMATTLRSFRKNKLETQCEPKSTRTVNFSAKRSDPVTIGFLESNCKREVKKPEEILPSEEVEMKSSKKVRLLSRSNFDSDYKVIKGWKKNLQKSELRIQNPVTLSYMDSSIFDKKPKTAVRKLTVTRKDSTAKVGSPNRSPGSKSPLMSPAKVHKKQPVFKIKELDYKQAIDNMRKVLKPVSDEDSWATKNPKKKGSGRIDLFDDEDSSSHDVFVQNKFSIEDDTQFLELAKRLDKYINANPTLVSPRKKQLDSQFKKPSTIGSRLRPLLKQQSIDIFNTKFSDEELEKVIRIYTQKPFHDRHRLLPESLNYMMSLVHRIPFFKPFSIDVIQNLLHGSTAMRMSAGKIVYGEEDTVSHMFVVLRGRVEVFKKDIDTTIKGHRFEIGDNSANKVMPLLMKGDASSLMSGATSSYVGLLNFGLDASSVKKILQVREVGPGFSFGEGKFFTMQGMESSSIESLAAFIRKFQNRPVSEEDLDKLVMNKDIPSLNRLKEEYTSHFVQAVKLKAIQKEQERFRCSVIENSRRVAEKIKRSEMVKCIDDCVFLRIAFNSFSNIILPLIKEELDVKMFCLHKIQFLSRFTTEELIPLAYHLVPRVYTLGDTIVNPKEMPKSMQLICRGICDIIWLNPSKGPVVNYDAYAFKTENPLTKFDDEIHDMIEELHSQRAQFKATSNFGTEATEEGFKKILSQQGFRVQRLIKGDAITVRGLAPPESFSHMSSSKDMYVLASSSSVTTFELEQSKVKYLPPEIRRSICIGSSAYMDYDMPVESIDQAGVEQC